MVSSRVVIAKYEAMTIKYNEVNSVRFYRTEFPSIEAKEARVKYLAGESGNQLRNHMTLFKVTPHDKTTKTF